MKPRIKKYLSISKKEWNGILVLIILTGFALAAPCIYQWLHKDSIIINPADFDRAIAQLRKGGNNPAADNIDAGKTDHIKGGASPCNPAADNGAANKLTPGTTIEVNTADSATLTRVHGIGPSFAVRIIRYRDRLGGFYREEQLKEVFGVDSAKYIEIKDQIRVNPAAVTRLRINKVSFDALRQFPYLKYKQVNAIIQYRAQHGSYQSINDLERIEILTPDVIRKIEPYLSYK